MGTLILLRHGESEWNALNLFTGWADPALTKKGADEAKKAAQAIKDDTFHPHSIFTSDLKRAIQTANIVAQKLSIDPETIIQNTALRERDYGDLSGLNKKLACETYGAEQVHRWRRGFKDKPPRGESLEETQMRVVAYWKVVVEPLLSQGHSILIVAHGNSLRALMMHLEQRSAQDIETIIIETGEAIKYSLDEHCRIVQKVSLKHTTHV